MSPSLNELQEKYRQFKEERDWEKFHQPKNIAMSISIEAGELMELFQWKDNVDMNKLKKDSELMDNIRDELADIILYCLSMAQRMEIDIEAAIEDKLDRNRERYDIETVEELNKEFNKWRKN